MRERMPNATFLRAGTKTTRLFIHHTKEIGHVRDDEHQEAAEAWFESQ